MTKRFILTGAPGSGKTTVARRLSDIGHDVVEEAATSLIASGQADGLDAPWEAPDFIPSLATRQRERERAPSHAALRFSDRSLFCTLALAEFQGRPAALDLVAEAGALAASGWFEQRVFFFDQLDFIVNTNARRITIEEARRFGAVHAKVYRHFGFQLVHVAAGAVEDRVRAILSDDAISLARAARASS